MTPIIGRNGAERMAGGALARLEGDWEETWTRKEFSGDAKRINKEERGERMVNLST
jgi:hypothetical protein